MPRKRQHHSVNFGHGRSPEFAAKHALREHFGDGHHGTVHAHTQRFNLFCEWLRDEHSINDLCRVSTELIAAYAVYLRFLILDQKIAIATATNRISTVNVVLNIMRDDNKIRMDNIGIALGQKRSYIRRRIPDGMYLDAVAKLRQQLIDANFIRVAAIVGLARTLGMRLRETILADLPRLQMEANKFGLINIQDGTKGGRCGAFAPRWIPVTLEIQEAINYAHNVSPDNSRNLLSNNENYIGFIRHNVNPARQILHLNGIRGFHELRAAYACDRYQRLVGRPAPVISRPENQSSEHQQLTSNARQIISRELGHERLEVTNSYLGSEKK